MGRVEKTVFISYRRTNAPWALAISQNLTHNGYDVFFDFNGIASGDFEEVILENIRARAHFIVLLSPSALEHCRAPGDWLRREIETALGTKRNIVPLMLEGFSFSTPTIAGQLTGRLGPLRNYNALSVPIEYFEEAMGRLREKYLNVALDMVLHPPSTSAARLAKVEQTAANSAPAITKRELTAQQWFERGFDQGDPDDEIDCFSEAIRLRPDYFYAFNNRGIARFSKGDLQGAIEDYNETIRLRPDYASAFNNRGAARDQNGDLQGAISDYSQAIRLQPDYANAFYNRALTWERMDNRASAISDYRKYLDLGGGKRDGDRENVERMIQELAGRG